MSNAETPRTFVVVLRPLPGTDPIKALRAILKIALRRCGMKCVAVQETNSRMERE
jgi:hypothetical protein